MNDFQSIWAAPTLRAYGISNQLAICSVQKLQLWGQQSPIPYKICSAQYNAMSPNLRRTLLIAGFILVSLGFLAVIFFVFFRSAPINGNTNQVGGNTNGLPGIGNGNINGVVIGNINALPNINGLPISTTPTLIASGGATTTETIVPASASGVTAVGLEGGLQYYDQNTGKFYRLSPDGLSKSELTDVVYAGVDRLTWAPSGNQAILEFPDQSKILYDFTTKKQTTLPKELNGFSFSPASDQMVSKYLDGSDPTNQWLIVSKPDGTSSLSVEHLGENAGKVLSTWSPNNQIIATYEKTVNTDQSEIIFLGAQGENFPSVNIEGRGFTPKWSPDGRRLLYSAYSAVTDDNPHLFLMSGSTSTLGSGLLDLGLDTTADKCVFSSTGSTIYCAVPYYLNPGSGPQPELSAGVPDNIYRIDLTSGQAELIARPVDSKLNQRFSATNLQLTAGDTYLFFTDAATGSIEKVRLR